MTDYEYDRAWAGSELRLRQIEEGLRAFHELSKEERESQEWFARGLRQQARDIHELRIRLNMQRHQEKKMTTATNLREIHPLFRATATVDSVLALKHRAPVHLNDVWRAVEQQALSTEVAEDVKDHLVRLGTALGYAAGIDALKRDTVLAEGTFFLINQINRADPREWEWSIALYVTSVPCAKAQLFIATDSSSRITRVIRGELDYVPEPA